ncbi:hypothetical protein COB87_000120 [Candidatus Wolfebacteria bacterium]|nr:hypothetical protein [Candidatus Wolfebacteria bacterium]
MKGNMQELMDFISENFVFDESIYPELKNANEEQKLRFAVRHQALHFGKTSGNIIAVSERVDHGKEMDMEVLKKNVSKAFINTLRLASSIGMTGEDIVAAVEKKYSN